MVPRATWLADFRHRRSGDTIRYRGPTPHRAVARETLIRADRTIHFIRRRSSTDTRPPELIRVRWSDPSRNKDYCSAYQCLTGKPRITDMWALPEVASMAIQSMHLDVQLLRANGLPLSWRTHFLLRKYPALIGLLASHRSQINLGPTKWLIRDLGGLGTMQSTILDVYEAFGAHDFFGRPDPLIVDVGAN